MTPFQRVLVAVSLSEADDCLLRHAAMIARLGPEAQVRLVYVATQGAGAGSPDRLDRLRNALGCDASCECREGAREDEILRAAAGWRADLILVGHRLRRRGVRSLARRLAMKAPCSVWMAPGDSPPLLDRILVPVDFSQRSAGAMKVAAAIARCAGRDEMFALHVYFDSAAATYEGHGEEMLVSIENKFWRFCAPVDLRRVDITPLFHESPHVPETICEVASRLDVNLIVMDTRGRSRSAAVLLGSVTEDVLRHSAVPVLAVKHFGARMTLLKVLLDPRFRHREGPRFG